ncbi:predicted protein [Naegleria gruberi]|uniref:Predicted protein n=1 Tax=Naegleria gruberi TaxID=5762 RepID=D2V1L5_NAEGR|nr:uncharacterized protein NAEGRDRAFT_45916 [Naegleria gruberi]EFC49331.1 predicted protein [Naegleria gruberi]|eukprot:XP_002682075.1 predicted protein [Naegleria gruberi strain NEG-M]
MSQSTIQETITDILKKHDKSAVGKLTKALIQKIIGTLEIEVSGQKKVLAKAIVDFIGADKFTVCTSGKSKDVEKLKDEIKHAFKEARDDDDDDDDEEDDGESVVEVEDGSNKRKREEVSEEDVKRFKAYEQIIDAKIAQMKLEKAETERVLQQLAAESEVRKYTDTIYTPLPTTNSSLLTEYENLRKDSAFTMKIANLFPEIDDTKKMVANLETRAFQLQVQAVNPELASKLAFIESNPLWRENMDKLKMAEKLLKFDHKEKGKTSFVKSYANAKIYDKKDKAEEKVNMFGSANGMKKVKKCFICNDPNHLIKDCPKRNKREGSEYVDDLFFPRGRRKKRGYSFHFEQMGYLEEERSFNGNSGYVERGCISSNKRRICSILWKGKFRRMVFGRERMVKKRSEYFERDWSFGTLSQSKSDSQVSAGPKERIIPTDYRFKTAQSVLFYPQIQVQHVEEVFRTRTNEQDRSNLGFYVRYEIRISPDEVEISYILTQVATWIEADPGKYSSHSLRIGGATEAAIMGIPDATIKAMGGWNSDAIDRYFRANFRGDRNGSHLMGF